ncbi:MAG: hypothetical protein ACI8YQ_004159 [Polaribacter sp.]|jgi:hypothetical protein
MKRYFTFFLALIFMTSFHGLQAQELQATITINTPLLQTTDPQIFKQLEVAMTEFLNTQQWTDVQYEPEERIQVNISLNITDELSANEFKGDLIIQSSRPVYGGDYQSVVVSNVDKGVQFTYEPFQPVQFSENLFIDNLSSVLSFYAYVIIGMDFDTFSPFGGDDYFQAANDIVNIVPNNLTSKYRGWRSLDGNQNRYWVIENLLNPRMRPIRQSLYDYHRLGLDTMHEDVETGKNVMLKAIEAVGKVNKAQANSMLVTMFADAKSSEIIEVFKEGTSQQKALVQKVMGRMDPANSNKYRTIGR